MREVGFVALPAEELPGAKVLDGPMRTVEGFLVEVVEYEGEIYLRTSKRVPGDWLHILM